MLAGGMNDCAMLIAIEITLARENKGCECGGQRFAWDKLRFSLLPELGLVSV